MFKKLKIIAALVFIVAIMCIAIPIPASADGGPIVSHDLWANLKEGQQVAVVTILNANKAKIDLFVSILDKTNQSHEVVFFVPIGTNTSNFYAVEETLDEFDKESTKGLDSIIRQGANNRQHAVQILFSGALLTNGVLLVPIWSPILLSGCGAAEPQPEATFETESSQISIYGIEENTDLNALISTTGLPGSVSDTLSKLKGQQIAVVKLQTHPQGSGSTLTRPSGECGIHLSWNTSFVSTESGKTYSYPLGTGASWSKPIELTRVYVVAPKGMDFDINYPAIGSNQSGYEIIKGARITDYYQIPSYAVDEARGDFGRVWRATYTQSNPTEDIVVVAKPQSAFSKLRANLEQSATPLSFIFALLISLLIWMLSWIFLMPRLLGKDSLNKPRLRWYFGLIYPAINSAFMIFPGGILYLLFLLGLTIPSLAILLFILGGTSIGFFSLIHGGHLGVPRGKAILSFIELSLISSAGYLILALIFGGLINVI